MRELYSSRPAWILWDTSGPSQQQRIHGFQGQKNKTATAKTAKTATALSTDYADYADKRKKENDNRPATESMWLWGCGKSPRGDLADELMVHELHELHE